MKNVWYYLRFNYLNNFIYNLKYWVEWLISSYNMSHLVLELVVKICMFHLFFLFLFLDDSKKPINNLWTISTRLDFFDSLQIASQFSCNILHVSNFFFSFFFLLGLFLLKKIKPCFSSLASKRHLNIFFCIHVWIVMKNMILESCNVPTLDRLVIEKHCALLLFGKSLFPCIHSHENNHKIGTQVYKIQILNTYMKIISILCIF